eukprot:snap_masked-scaffold_45-processed-gene-0.13-mRNA-1 protein AED:1.00 eAED:1.00 QI:0/0/0/0/1/1/2/0/111
MHGKETSLVDKKEKSSKNQIRQNSGVDVIFESHRERNRKLQRLHAVNIAQVSKNVIKFKYLNVVESTRRLDYHYNRATVKNSIVASEDKNFIHRNDQIYKGARLPLDSIVI